MAYRVSGSLSWQTLRPLFWVLTTLYLLHQLARWRHYPLPRWVEFYLDDLLCLPLVLTLTLFLMRFFFGPQVRFSGYHISFAVLYFAVAFEVLFPRFLPRYTADALDAALYAAGGWLFYRFLNK